MYLQSSTHKFTTSQHMAEKSSNVIMIQTWSQAHSHSHALRFLSFFAGFSMPQNGLFILVHSPNGLTKMIPSHFNKWWLWAWKHYHIYPKYFAQRLAVEANHNRDRTQKKIRQNQLTTKSCQNKENMINQHARNIRQGIMKQHAFKYVRKVHNLILVNFALCLYKWK